VHKFNREKIAMLLENKVALITGCGGFITQRVALGLARQGAVLMLSDRRPEAVETVVRMIKDDGHEAIGEVADTTVRADAQRVVQRAVEHYRRIDVLVNAAADQRYFPFFETSDEDWDKINGTNVKGYFIFSQEVGRQMVDQRSGKIINYSSDAGLFGSTGHLAYGPSKAAVINLTKVTATELGPYGIQVNAILPGQVTRVGTGRPVHTDEQIQARLSRVPLGRQAQPDDLVGPTIFLASELSDYVTGVTLPVDGGWASCGTMVMANRW
jgi:NAD(P)-dependent dehydrogenase (short-subunit alcohol dehydrogenase family)